MLNQQQYEALKTHKELIAEVVRTSSSTNPAAWETMQTIWMEMGNPPANGYCGSCALTLYRDMLNLILLYEQQHGS